MNNLDTAKSWAKKLGKCPGVVAIFLSGSLAQGRGNKDSDIDFFIIARPGQIWTARFWVFIILKLHRKLAKPHHHAGMICPNHFITSDNLEISEKDAYSANLFSHNQALYDPENIFPQFAKANAWVNKFGTTFPAFPNTEYKILNTKTSLFGTLNENLLKYLQTWITKRNPEYKTPGAKIILTNHELRFHPKPRNKDWSK